MAAPFRFASLVCVQRAALKAPPPFGRTLSFQDSAMRLFKRCGLLGPKPAGVPFRRVYPVAEGVGRDGTPVGQACTADRWDEKAPQIW